MRPLVSLLAAVLLAVPVVSAADPPRKLDLHVVPTR